MNLQASSFNPDRASLPQLAHETSYERLDILDVLDKHLILSAASGESKVFYHKM